MRGCMLQLRCFCRKFIWCCWMCCALFIRRHWICRELNVSLVQASLHGGLLVGWRQTHREERGIRDQSRVVETLFTGPGQHGKEIGHLVLRQGLGEVDAEDLPLWGGALAAAVQEEQQECQEEHHGGRQYDAQKRLYVFFG